MFLSLKFKLIKVNLSFSRGCILGLGSRARGRLRQSPHFPCGFHGPGRLSSQCAGDGVINACRGRRRSPAKHGLLAALARARHLPRRGVLIPQSAVPDDVPESCLGRWHLNAFSAFQTSALANSWETRTNDTRCGFPVPHSFPTAFVFRIPCRVGLGERVRIILTYL